MNNNTCGCNNDLNDCNNCIREILQVICMLQSNACPAGSLNSCDRPSLGIGPTCISCNTRPIILYTCCGNGVAWSMPTTRTETATTSSTVFRVEKVDGCCCTCRVLAENPDTTAAETTPYVSTDSFVTFNLNCCGALTCLADTYISGV